MHKYTYICHAYFFTPIISSVCEFAKPYDGARGFADLYSTRRTGYIVKSRRAHLKKKNAFLRLYYLYIFFKENKVNKSRDTIVTTQGSNDKKFSPRGRKNVLSKTSLTPRPFLPFAKNTVVNIIHFFFSLRTRENSRCNYYYRLLRTSSFSEFANNFILMIEFSIDCLFCSLAFSTVIF